MEDAADAGHLNVVRFLHEHRDEGCTWLAMVRDATNGHIDVVKYLHVNSLKGGTARAIDGAVSNNHLSVVKYLIWDAMVEEGEVRAMASAIQNEQDDIVKFSCNYFNVYPGTEITNTEGAIKCCDKLCHAFLHSDEVVKCATKNGNYGVLKLLLKKYGLHCPDDAIQSAIKCGNTEILELLLQTGGTKFPVYDLEWAVSGSKLEIVKLVYDSWNSLPVQGTEDLAAKGKSVLSKTTFYGSLEIVQWVLQTMPDCASFKAVRHAESRGDLDFLLLVLERVELTSHQRSAVVETAISHEQLAVVKYLYERWPSFKVNEECLWGRRDYDLAEYLHTHAGVFMDCAITDVTSCEQLDLVRFYLPIRPHTWPKLQWAWPLETGISMLLSFSIRMHEYVVLH